MGSFAVNRVAGLALIAGVLLWFIASVSSQAPYRPTQSNRRIAGEARLVASEGSRDPHPQHVAWSKNWIGWSKSNERESRPTSLSSRTYVADLTGSGTS